MRCVPFVLDLLLAFCASFSTGYVRLKDFTVKVMNRRVELDVLMIQTLSLPLQRMPLLYNMFTCIWVQATVHPRRNHLLHDLITQVFLRSLQYGIVVMGFIDAFVYAHHRHRRSIENPANSGDCMKGRIRFMTAVRSAYAHAYQVTCLTRHMPAVPPLNFRLPKPQARYPHLPTFVPQHVKEAMTSKDEPSILTEVVAMSMVKP